MMFIKTGLDKDVLSTMSHAHCLNSFIEIHIYGDFYIIKWSLKRTTMIYKIIKKSPRGAS